jgi:methylmalonyl-CoA mutase
MIKNKLFNDFHTHTKAQWKQQAIKDLKGKIFEDTLLWSIDKNIQIEPYYSSEDSDKLPLKAIQTPQAQRNSGNWQNCEILVINSEKESNHLIISSIKSGSESILLDLSGVLIREIEFKKLLNNIKLSDTPFFFKLANGLTDLVEALQMIAPYQWKGGIDYDEIANWMLSGQWNQNHWNEMASIIRKVQNHTQFRVLTINGHQYHNAGANIIQELAFTLSSAIETIDKLSQQGLDIEQIVSNIDFSISIGTNYFVEIAKIRALKLLWQKLIVDGYQLNKVHFANTNFHGITSAFYDAGISPHTNMLRATTEAMSAIIGGCNRLSIRPFDATSESQTAFSHRIARNISIILKEESYFDKVIDPSAGSYFIENLTNQFFEEALLLLNQVENLGGIINAFENGFVQKNIAEQRIAKQTQLQENQTIMIGVNKYRFDEKDFQLPQKKASLKNTLPFELLPVVRLSEFFETIQ